MYYFEYATNSHMKTKLLENGHLNSILSPINDSLEHVPINALFFKKTFEAKYINVRNISTKKSAK